VTRPPAGAAPGTPAGRLRSVAWILGLALLISAALFATQIRRALRGPHAMLVGNGRDVASYGFDLDTCLVPREVLVAAGLPKDGLASLDRPPLMSAAAVDSLNAAERGKYLVAEDRVIGVELGGAARAYPLRVMNWHEITNDTLGGRPVAVTYSPLADACVAFDRRIDGRELEFGVSGLLLDSNLLMYDRRPGGEGESLWSQLQARAVTGPAAAAARTLVVLPAAVVTWREWRALHPRTTVLFPAPERRASYKRDPYGSYDGSDLLRFPVRPAIPPGDLRNKDHIVALPRPGGWITLALKDLVARAGPDGELLLPLPERGLRIRVSESPPTVLVQDAEDGRPQPCILSYWFAWYALHPDDRLLDLL
jgi:hypothetical protein